MCTPTLAQPLSMSLSLSIRLVVGWDASVCSRFPKLAPPVVHTSTVLAAPLWQLHSNFWDLHLLWMHELCTKHEFSPSSVVKLNRQRLPSSRLGSFFVLFCFCSSSFASEHLSLPPPGSLPQPRFFVLFLVFFSHGYHPQLDEYASLTETCTFSFLTFWFFMPGVCCWVILMVIWYADLYVYCKQPVFRWTIAVELLM